MPISYKNINIAIKVSNLNKTYFITRADGKGQQQIDALKDINLEVRKGEVVGIVGPNGSGKSTLLKVLSEITAPTSGTIEIDGKVASILEVGTGFNPDLSGRQNIYLNAALHGMKSKEVDSKFNNIVELFGFPDFLDTPVKHYSSGMYMRLAFAVVVHIDADIYLFDEVLSVGDDEFKNKVKENINSLVNYGASILIVTHAAKNVLALLNRLLLFNSGTISFNGKPSEGLVIEYKSLTNGCANRVEQLEVDSLPFLKKIRNEFITDLCDRIEIIYIRVKNTQLYMNSPLNCDNDLIIETIIVNRSLLNYGLIFNLKDYNDSVICSFVYNDNSMICNKYKLILTIPQEQLLPNYFILDLLVVKDTQVVLSYSNILMFTIGAVDGSMDSAGYLKINYSIDKEIND